MRHDTATEPPPLAEGTRPVPLDETADTGTLLCPTLPPDLHYVDDAQPGIRRRQLRGKFAYFAPSGERIRDEEEIRRINKLAIPRPIGTSGCPDPQGISRPRDAMPADASSIVTIRAGGKSATATSTSACWSSAKPCPLRRDLKST